MGTRPSPSGATRARSAARASARSAPRGSRSRSASSRSAARASAPARPRRRRCSRWRDRASSSPAWGSTPSPGSRAAPRARPPRSWCARSSPPAKQTNRPAVPGVIMRAVTDPFAGLEPPAFWRHFEALTRIPRATYEEERAGARGFVTRRDGAGNLVVDVPATPGREGAPTVILQGHLDIVCERDPDSPFDPREGRIGVVRDGEWLRADGTTLGADDGVAIAAMLALVEDPRVAHGPLELLMTVAEEVGMAGAADLDPALIGGSVLLNLDSEEDATLTVGCAGGADSILHVDAPRSPVGREEIALRVGVSGGRGGHSGGDIAAGRSNAIRLLARALSAAPALRIASLDGGASRNAIPREAAAVVAVPAGGEAEAGGGGD